jgi:hypothetical protein
VLQTSHIHLVHIEKISRQLVIIEPLVVDLEANLMRILISARHIIHDNRMAMAFGRFTGQRLEEIGGEGGNATSSREEIADQGDIV